MNLEKSSLNSMRMASLLVRRRSDSMDPVRDDNPSFYERFSLYSSKSIPRIEYSRAIPPPASGDCAR